MILYKADHLASHRQCDGKLPLDVTIIKFATESDTADYAHTQDYNTQWLLL